MMNYMLSALFIALISLSASAQNYCGGKIQGGDRIPWPWGLETKYPLKQMQGVWQTTSGDCKNQFIFKVTDSANGKIVKIMQYDPVSCKSVGLGSGFLSEKIVIAQMNKKGVAYNMTIHVFNEADVQEMKDWSDYQQIGQPTLVSDGKHVIVISLYPVGKWDEKTTYQIVKVDAATNMICQ